MAEEEKKEETTKLDDDVQKNVDAYAKGKDFIGSTHKEVNSFIGKNVIDGFTVIHRSKNSIFYFPVYCSKSLTVNEAHAIAKMFERVYADFVQNAISQQKRIIDADEIDALKFLNKFHTNLIDESANTLNRYFGSEPLDRLDEIIYSSCHNILETYDGYMVSYGCKDNISTDYVSEHENNLHEFFQGLNYLQEETVEDQETINQSVKKEDAIIRDIYKDQQEMMSLRRLQEREIDDIGRSNLNEFINKDEIDDSELEKKIISGLKDDDLKLYNKYEDTKECYEKQIEYVNDIINHADKLPELDYEKINKLEIKADGDISQEAFNEIREAIGKISDNAKMSFDPNAAFVEWKYDKDNENKETEKKNLSDFRTSITLSFLRSKEFKNKYIDNNKIKQSIQSKDGTEIVVDQALRKDLINYIKDTYKKTMIDGNGNKKGTLQYKLDQTSNMKGVTRIHNLVDNAKGKIKQYKDTENKINQLNEKINNSIDKLGNVVGAAKLKEELVRGEVRTYEELRKLAYSAGTKPVTILKDTDIKKINGMLPYNLNLEMWIKPGSKERANWDGNYRALTIQVGIKTVLHLVDPKDLDDEVEEIINGSKRRFDKIRFQTGEMNWIQYIFKSKENKEAIKKAKTDKSKRWINTLKKLGKYKETYGGLFKPLLPILTGFKKTNAPIPNASMVLTAIDVDNLKYATGIDFNKVSTVNKFASQMFLITFIIVDSSTRTIKTLYPGESDDWDIVSLDSVEDLLAKSSNIDFMREIKKSINR